MHLRNQKYIYKIIIVKKELCQSNPDICLYPESICQPVYLHVYIRMFVLIILFHTLSLWFLHIYIYINLIYGKTFGMTLYCS